MTTAQEIINIAASQIGYTEYPPNSNMTKYGEWYGMNGEPWCDMFVSWVFAQADASNLIGGQFAYCPYHERWFEENNLYNSIPEIGAIVFFGYPVASHIGIVKEIANDGIYTIEGNTSLASDDNGGAVMQRFRSYDSGYIRGYGIPQYKEKPITDDCEEDMQCLIKPDGQDYMVWYDGNRLHGLCHPDEMTAIQDIYRHCTGKEIPIFEYGTKDAPWFHRFADAVDHDYKNTHM